MILEIKSWKTKLEAAAAQSPHFSKVFLSNFFFRGLPLLVTLRPAAMVDALVKDISAFLTPIESGRVSLEGLISTGSVDDDKIRKESQSLNNSILDYQKTAAHAKRHCTKPKPKAKAAA